MATKKMIAVKQFCQYHDISTSFIQDLHRNGLITVVKVNRTGFIAENNLHIVERMVRLHTDLHINIEGIRAIFQLLNHVEQKENELKSLRNQLRFYEHSSIA